ncbi:MAG: hypothetical protein GY719_28905 [bacterium]|nr:hypothetical protein [bacterium]
MERTHLDPVDSARTDGAREDGARANGPALPGGLTLADVALLADGTGNIPDDTAARLAPLIVSDARLAGHLAELWRMAEESTAACLADAHDAHASFAVLESATWLHPTDVLDPRLDVPYGELLSIAAARAARAPRAERARLLMLEQRLEQIFTEDLANGEPFLRLGGRLLEVDDATAEATARRLVERFLGDWCRSRPDESTPGASTPGEGAGR